MSRQAADPRTHLTARGGRRGGVGAARLRARLHKTPLGGGGESRTSPAPYHPSALTVSLPA
jgi:hypothetical protein